MSIANNYAPYYQGSSTAATFDVTVSDWSIQADTPLIVEVINNATGAVQVQTEGTPADSSTFYELRNLSGSDYGVVRVSNTWGAGVEIYANVRRNIAPVQAWAPQTNSGANVRTAETAIDDVVESLQQVYTEVFGKSAAPSYVGGVIRADDAFRIVPKDVRATKYLKFDANGDPEYTLTANGDAGDEIEAIAHADDTLIVSSGGAWVGFLAEGLIALEPFINTYNLTDHVGGTVALWGIGNGEFDLGGADAAEGPILGTMAANVVYANYDLRFTPNGRARISGGTSGTSGTSGDTLYFSLDNGAGVSTNYFQMSKGAILSYNDATLGTIANPFGDVFCADISCVDITGSSVDVVSGSFGASGDYLIGSSGIGFTGNASLLTFTATTATIDADLIVDGNLGPLADPSLVTMASGLFDVDGDVAADSVQFATLNLSETGSEIVSSGDFKVEGQIDTTEGGSYLVPAGGFDPGNSGSWALATVNQRNSTANGRTMVAPIMLAAGTVLTGWTAAMTADDDADGLTWQLISSNVSASSISIHASGTVTRVAAVSGRHQITDSFSYTILADRAYYLVITSVWSTGTIEVFNSGVTYSSRKFN